MREGENCERRRFAVIAETTNFLQYFRVSFGFRSRGLMSLPDPPFSTRSRVAGRTMALRVSTPLCPERTQQEIGAGRIARSSRPVPAGTAIRREMRRRDISIASGGWRCSFSVPLERRACSPHAMQDDGKLAGNRHGCLLGSDAFAKGFA